MKEEIIISGSGGQGVLLAGSVLSCAAMKEGRFVTSFPSYGAEMRCGAASSQVIISDNPIGAPIAEDPAILVALNKISYEKFSPKIKRGGTIFANSSLYKPEKRSGIEIVEIPANNLAEECGLGLLANMVMLGALVSKSGILKVKSIVSAIPLVLSEKKDLWKMNERAVEMGFSWVTEQALK